MTPAKLCEELAGPLAAAQREQLLAAAAAAPDCLPLALEQARSLTSATPGAALRFAEVATEIARRRSEPAQAGAALRVRGQALRVLGRHEEAIQAFTAAAEYARQAGDDTLAAQFQVGSIDSMGMLGRYEEAVRLARHLEQELRAAGSELHAARALCNEGSIHFRQDRLGRALDCYERAGELLARHGDDLMVAAVCINRANVLTQLGQLDAAMALYQEAQEIYDARGMPIEAAVVETNWGYLEHVCGRPAAALRRYRHAVDAFVAAGRGQDSARCDIDMADAYRVLNLYPEALACCDAALAALRELSLDYDRARAHLARAAALLGLGRHGEAHAALTEAEGTFHAQGNRLQCAHVRLVRAALLRANGQPDEAVTHARIADRVFTRAGLRGWAAEARLIAASVAPQAGRPSPRRLRAISRTACETGRGWLECRAELALGRYYAGQGKAAPALRHLRASVAALERARTLIAPEGMHVAYLQDKQEVYGELVSLLLERGRDADVAEAFEYVERSRSQLLLERLHNSLDGSGAPQVAPELRERLRRLRAELSRLQHLAHWPGDGTMRRELGPAPTEAAIIQAEAAYGSALREMELQTAAPHLRLPGSLPLECLRAALGPDEILVEFAAAGSEVCAFTLSPSGLAAWRSVSNWETVRGLARRLRYHLQKMEVASHLPEAVRHSLVGEAQSVLGQLYDHLLRPLAPALEQYRSVVVIPHGVLHGLPFHAFWDGERYAVDQWEILYAPSATIWHHRAQLGAGSGGGTPLLMAVPGPGIEHVPVEIESVARSLRTARTCTGAAADLEAFRREAPTASIIHVATHARFRSNNPLFSGLQFADGWLLARDLYEMRLRCDLATLSACETGSVAVEPGDELFGLVRGFLAAGARSVAASLWPAHDAATADLMGSFYEAVATGCSKSAALRQAQQHTRKRFPHPYHWAPFVVIGAR